MAAKKKSGGPGRKLLTLSEISKRATISMPTLQRYKKLYQDRIPSVGEGRKQRYPIKALAVFAQIKKENLARRGRPRKEASAPALPPRKKAATTRGPKKAAESSGSGDLLTLTRIGELTSISYPTLLRYVRLHGASIPSVGSGRRRRFKPEAVEVFSRLRGESRRGGRPKRKGVAGQPARATVAQPEAGMDPQLEKRLAALERTQARLVTKLEKLVAKLSKPRKLI